MTSPMRSDKEYDADARVLKSNLQRIQWQRCRFEESFYEHGIKTE